MPRINTTDTLDASLALELEVTDTSAAYKMDRKEVEALLSNDTCLFCNEGNDIFGVCINPLCEIHDIQ